MCCCYLLYYKINDVGRYEDCDDIFDEYGEGKAESGVIIKIVVVRIFLIMLYVLICVW